MDKIVTVIHRAFQTLFLVLMGEFDFRGMRVTPFSRMVSFLWFFFFEALVYLLLFNILLGIVMDVFTQVTAIWNDLDAGSDGSGAI